MADTWMVFVGSADDASPIVTVQGSVAAPRLV
jgi:hypothetical protein